jgi:exodeoxyribonuclease V alpha subunit
MTTSPPLEWGAQIAHRVTGKLGEFNRAGVLGVADVHAAATICRVGGESREKVQLAVALTVRALRTGSVCIDLAAVAQAVFADTAAEDANIQLDVSQLDWPDPDDWMQACLTSPVITMHQPASVDPASAARPLRMADGLLYLERYWHQQETVRQVLRRRATAVPPVVDLDRLREGLARVFDSTGLESGEPDLQRLAAAVGVLQWVSVLAGGPGTGKTTTVAALLALLRDQTRPSGQSLDGDRQTGALRVALAAPTGKAAARLEEAVRAAADRMADDGKITSADQAWITQLSSSTLHRLLGWVPDSRSRFRHNAANHLPYDVVVVDEMSMVSLTLMARLLEALRPDARLILVGDPDQLSSVEAGAVLADIVNAPGRPAPAIDAALATVKASEPAPTPGPRNGAVRLRHTWRFGGVIDELAQAIRASDDDRVIDILRSGEPGLIFTEIGQDSDPPDSLPEPAPTQTQPGSPIPAAGVMDRLRGEVLTAGRMINDAARWGDIAGALAGLDQHRLLCAHRTGPFGVTRWSRETERWLTEAIEGYGTAGEWYPGRPLLITANDYELGLYNGDTGVAVQTSAGVRAAFGRGGEPTLIAPARLDSVQTMHALTVHRAQGSQFRAVTFVVPPPESPLLTRELLYTAVTRATQQVYVIGTEAAIRRATRRPANRASGLRSRLAAD